MGTQTFPVFPILSTLNIRTDEMSSPFVQRVMMVLRIPMEKYQDHLFVKEFYAARINDLALVTVKELFGNVRSRWPATERLFWDNVNIYWLYALIRTFGPVLFEEGINAIRQHMGTHVGCHVIT